MALSCRWIADRKVQLGLLALLFGIMPPAIAQVIADPSLGTTVTSNGAILEITNGTTVGGRNLFHSFSRFDVPNGSVASFLNAPAIANIFARVTGGTASDIQGIIRAQGTANLFLMNPQGILFGPNAQLNMGGSFVATSANAIQFPGGGSFTQTATVDPANALLSVDPSALFFNQLNPGAITVQSQAPAGVNPFGNPTTGLRVPDGQSLLFIGGTVNLSNTGLRAYGGRVELAGLATPGTVTLIRHGAALGLQMPGDVTRADIAVVDSAISSFAATGGDIGIYAQNINLVQSSLFSGIGAGLGFVGAQAGNITLNGSALITLQGSVVDAGLGSLAIGKAGSITITTGTLNLDGGSGLFADSWGQGDAGTVTLTVRDRATFHNSDILINVGSQATGNSGALQVEVGSLSLLNGSQFVATNAGRGNTGSITIHARDRILLDGRNQNGFASGIFSFLEGTGTGRSEDIWITTGALSLTNGAQIGTGVNGGQGNAGNIIIQASGLLTVQGQASAILNRVQSGGIGNSGDITITADAALLTQRGQIITAVQGREQFSAPSEGNAGRITLNIRDNLTLTGFGSQIASNTGVGAVGNGGAVGINAGALSLLDQSAILSSASGQGNAGSVNVQVADTVTLAQGGQISSLLLPGSTGRGGDIAIQANSLFLSDTLGIATSTLGRGDGGNIAIAVQDTIQLRNSPINSGALSAVGNGGNITLNAGSLIVQTENPPLTTQIYTGLDNLNNTLLIAQIGSSSLSGQGNSGTIQITARDAILVQGGSGTGISSSLGNSTGQAGDVIIETGSLTFRDGAILASATQGQGNAGNIVIDARDRVSLENRASILSIVGTSAQGDGGTIDIRTANLFLNSNAAISSSTFGQGNAGNVRITARDRIQLQTSGIFADTGTSSAGRGGTIQIVTDRLDANQSVALVNSQGRGIAGNIEITANRVGLSDRSQIAAETASMDGGNITLGVQDVLVLRDRSAVSTTAGIAQAGGNGGNITINIPNGFIVAVAQENSDITANAFTGRGGNVQITAQGIFGLQFRPQLTSESDITASSQFGVNGVVAIDTPGVDPSRGLVPVPVGLVDQSNLITQRCASRSNSQKTSSFYIIGRGGIPYRPGDLPMPHFATGDVRAIPDATHEASPISDRSPTTLPQARSHPHPPQEATHWVRDSQGIVFLVATKPVTRDLYPVDCSNEH